MKSLPIKKMFFLALFCMAFYSLLLNTFPLLDPDEPVYGETAKEMLAFEDWLSPRIYGTFWYDKPPLFYWAEAISFSLLGISDGSARFPSLLFGVLTVLTTYGFGRKLLEEKIAFYGALILATSLEFILLTGASVTDMLLTWTLTVALFSFLLEKYIPAYVFCGLALLAKGPVGFGFPALIVAIWMLFTKQFTTKNILSLKWYWGIPLACLVGIPWYIYMGIVHGQPFIDTFLGYHNVTRFVTPEHQGQNHFFRYIPVLLIGMYPWTGAIPGILYRSRSYFQKKILAYLLTWSTFIFLFFSLSATQLISYILPMYPPLSLLMAYYLFEIEENEKARNFFMGSHIFFSVVLGIALLFVPYEPIGGKPFLYTLALAVGIASILNAYFYKENRVSHFFCGQAAFMVIFIASVWTAFAPIVTTNFSTYNIGKKLEATLSNQNIPIYIDAFYRPSIAFYQDIYGLPLSQLSESDDQLKNGAYILLQKQHYRNWPENAKKNTEIIWEEDTAYLVFKKGD